MVITPGSIRPKAEHTHEFVNKISFKKALLFNRGLNFNLVIISFYGGLRRAFIFFCTSITIMSSYKLVKSHVGTLI